MSDETTTCVEPGCGTVRTDEPDYTPVQPIFGQPLGWYSGDDGEFCPRHIAELMSLGNRRPYQYFMPGGGIGITEREARVVERLDRDEIGALATEAIRPNCEEAQR